MAKLLGHISFALLTIISCKPAKPSFNDHTTKAIAWYEDSVKMLYIVFLSNSQFIYRTAKKQEGAIYGKEQYQGLFKDAKDSIYLHFDEKGTPAHVANYLVKEISGKYLIQYFRDSSKRVFLRMDAPFDVSKAW